ncbi:MAG: 1-phosphofructokinase family hexose kinase [Oscillospiraceae bacterium]|jgi:1-phosphofructokinase|nr:1-phosphofructokinase family hexose kinase [Oscillospiraceae bacterium]
MITTLCLNPAIDREVQVNAFAMGATNRILVEHSQGAGKGVHVAIVASRLGMAARCVGLLAQGYGQLILDRLARDGVEGAFVSAPGDTRVNIKIQDVATRTVTELNEPGVPVTEDQLLHVRRAVTESAARSDFLVLTGSLPPGCPPDFYNLLIEDAGPSCRCVVDVAGDQLLGNIRAKPYLVKPNLQELQQSAGRPLKTLRDIRDQALSLVEAGASVVAVSMGAEGAMITNGKLTLFAPGMSVPVHSTVGAGDSMVAGLLRGLREGGNLKNALRCGVAAATATVADTREGLMQYAAYEDFYQRVKVGAV